MIIAIFTGIISTVVVVTASPRAPDELRRKWIANSLQSRSPNLGLAFYLKLLRQEP